MARSRILSGVVGYCCGDWCVGAALLVGGLRSSLKVCHCEGDEGVGVGLCVRSARQRLSDML